MGFDAIQKFLSVFTQFLLDKEPRPFKRRIFYSIDMQTVSFQFVGKVMEFVIVFLIGFTRLQVAAMHGNGMKRER